MTKSVYNIYIHNYEYNEFAATISNIEPRPSDHNRLQAKADYRVSCSQTRVTRSVLGGGGKLNYAAQKHACVPTIITLI